MSPLQVRIIPVAEKFADYAEQIQAELTESFVRTDIDYGNDSFNKKIRNAVTSKIPNMLIVGDKEREAGTVSWRRYSSKHQKSMGFQEFKGLLGMLISERVMDNFPETELPEVS